MKRTARAVPNAMTPCIPITFREDICMGCNRCVEVCRCDVMIPNPEKGKPPVVLYPDECWFCGCCVQDCPVEGACEFHHPLGQKVPWKRKETGELFRTDMKGLNPPTGRKPYF